MKVAGIGFDAQKFKNEALYYEEPQDTGHGDSDGCSREEWLRNVLDKHDLEVAFRLLNFERACLDLTPYYPNGNAPQVTSLIPLWVNGCFRNRSSDILEEHMVKIESLVAVNKAGRADGVENTNINTLTADDQSSYGSARKAVKSPNDLAPAPDVSKKHILTWFIRSLIDRGLPPEIHAILMEWIVARDRIRFRQEDALIKEILECKRGFDAIKFRKAYMNRRAFLGLNITEDEKKMRGDVEELRSGGWI